MYIPKIKLNIVSRINLINSCDEKLCSTISYIENFLFLHNLNNLLVCPKYSRNNK